ncbi:hypothetical protein Z043_107390 [Scleropages formosus]|uniref:Forkhead box protein N3 n=1 Tax=Scleropages formosus TaxID=113540 RepID=A0A0N8K0Z6_SCLFO|nr:hypothetical protein Z043_107390 [Scleropages formosus]
MGPVMPPSKKPEGSGIGVASGLSPLCGARTLSRALQEAEDVDVPLAKPHMEDEELTNLNWLHESKNLLNSFGDQVLRSVSPLQELEDDTPPSPAPSDLPYDAKHNPNCKPPYSFSCLIFMAIEDSPSKRLPVKDIYNWILEHFPYFANAPTGWKNSVRHNLSLNKCFKKVDKDRSQNIGKGSLWCIDPEYRQNLIQALKKTPYHPYSPVLATPPTSPQAYQSMSSPPLWPGSPFFRKNGEVLLPVVQSHWSKSNSVDEASSLEKNSTKGQLKYLPSWLRALRKWLSQTSFLFIFSVIRGSKPSEVSDRELSGGGVKPDECGPTVPHSHHPQVLLLSGPTIIKPHRLQWEELAVWPVTYWGATFGYGSLSSEAVEL